MLIPGFLVYCDYVFVVCLPLLECQLPESRGVSLFYLLLYLKHPGNVCHCCRNEEVITKE